MALTADPAVLIEAAEMQLAELQLRLGPLSLDALTDSAAAQELAEVRAGIAEARAIIEQASLAKGEAGRRAEVERERVAADARAEAVVQARKIQTRIEAQYQEWDAAVAKLGELTRRLLGSWSEQDGHLAATGRQS